MVENVVALSTVSIRSNQLHTSLLQLVNFSIHQLCSSGRENISLALVPTFEESNFEHFVTGDSKTKRPVFTMTDILTRDTTGGIAILTLNRPRKLNALSYALLDELSAQLDTLERDESVRAVVVTGAGDRAFSAGADIAEFEHSVRAGVSEALREFCRRGQNVTRRLENYPKPIIAAVNGLAYGGGCEITEAMTLTVAAESAEFCKSEIRLGLIPDFGGTQRLPRLVGRKRGLEMILTGDPITAQKAYEIGLVNFVVRSEDVLSEAIALAKRVTRYSPIAVEACLVSVMRGINVSIDEGLAVEAYQFARTVPTEDLREGMSAFLEKREPKFTGR